MVFMLRMASILSGIYGHLALSSGRIAAGLPLSMIFSGIMLLGMIVSENSESGSRKIMRTRAQNARVLLESTTNVVLLQQRLVTRLVLPLDVVEKGAARRHQLQETPA